MKRLTGLDAGFLWMETPTSAMHVSGLAIYDPKDLGDRGRDFGIEDVRSMVEGRLHLAPPFRQRLVEVPFQLHFPLWIEDPNFDLGNHIKHVAVPKPGGTRELADLAAELNAIHLDRTRPLWEMWFIEGLEDGRFATLTKVHHAAIDGASGSEITVALFDLTPEVAEHPLPDEPWEPDKVPSDIEMLAHAAESLARQPMRVLRALRRTGEGGARRALAEPAARSPTSLPLPFTAPRTSINGAITPARSVALSSASLNEVKRVKNAFGTTVNDVDPRHVRRRPPPLLRRPRRGGRRSAARHGPRVGPARGGHVATWATRSPPSSPRSPPTSTIRSTGCSPSTRA